MKVFRILVCYITKKNINVRLFAFKGSIHLLKFGLSQIYKNYERRDQKLTKQTSHTLHT
jgi:hypothetical protein